jgi:hypothetical protein
MLLLFQNKKRLERSTPDQTRGTQLAQAQPPQLQGETSCLLEVLLEAKQSKPLWMYD